MAFVWFQCPLCGAQWQGDQRYQPMCPNIANQPRVPPGPLVQPITTATLGDTYDAFEAKYGAGQRASPGPSFAWKVTIDGIHALVTETLDAPASSDALYHIDRLSLAPDGGTWTQATTDNVSPTFLPDDAVQQPDVTIPGAGAEHVYMSTALGATFPANWFVDHQGHQVSPGTFSAAFDASKGIYTLRLGE